MNKLKISISPSMCLLLLFMIATTPLPQLLGCLTAAAIHECGHLAAAKLFSIDLTHIRLDVLGARLTTTGKLYAYPALACLCLGGPLVNLLCFFIALPFTQHSVWISEFCLASIALCVLNLIPIQGFDGGRVVQGLLCQLFDLRISEKICAALSFCSLLIMWMLSIWLLLRSGASLSLFVFSCCLFSMLFL